MKERILPLPSFYNYTKEAGRTHAYIDCPVCGETEIQVFMWSFHASGKKCPRCKSHIHLSGVYVNSNYKIEPKLSRQNFSLERIK